MKLSDSLQPLLSHQSEGLCISAYIDVDARERNIGDIQTVVNSMFIEMKNELKKSELPKADFKILNKDIEKVITFFKRNLIRTGVKTLAVFSNKGGAFFETLSLPLKLGDSLRVNKEFYLSPLLAALDAMPVWAFLLLDRSRYSIGLYGNARLLKYETHKPEVPARVKSSGWFSLEESRIRRHIDEHIRFHVGEGLRKLERSLGNTYIDGFLVGSHKELRDLLVEMMPSSLKKLFIGFIHLEPGSSTIKVLEKLNEFYDIKRKEFESRAISHLNNAVTMGGLAVIGLQQVLRALNMSAVGELFNYINFNAEGYVCPNKHYLSVSEGVCPMCSKELTGEKNIVIETTTKARSNGAKVTTIFNKEIWPVEEPIGALLRFPV